MKYLTTLCICLALVVGCENRDDKLKREALAILSAPPPATYTPNQQKTLTAAQATVEKAERVFGVELDLTLRFGELDGVATAYRVQRGDRVTYLLGFNAGVVERDPRLVIDKAVPHEVAHFVSWAKGEKEAHDMAWIKYCRELADNKDFCKRTIK